MDYSERWDEIWSEKRRVTSGKLGSLLARDIIHRTVAGILKKEIADPRDKWILEPGSGTGLISLELAKRGARVFLLDLSPEAVNFSRDVFAREKAGQDSVQASILDLPFKDDAFDITWNGGVVEHFEKDQQIQILKEMLRVTKPGGIAIIIVPSSQGRIYMKAKGHADRHKVWQPGYEVPMSTFANMAPYVPGRLIREYRTGFLAELHFMKYYFGKSRFLRFAWAGLVEIISRILLPLNRLPGYLLVAVFEKQS
jgi:SAM-dependent methyltransferase